MVLACPYNITLLHYYIITLLRFHFPTSLFRTFTVGTDIFVPDVKTGREWFAWMMDNLPLDQLLRETASAVLAKRCWIPIGGFHKLSPILSLPFKAKRGDFVDFASKRGGGTRVVTAVKTSKEEGGRIISEKTVSKSAFFCNFAPAKH